MNIGMHMEIVTIETIDTKRILYQQLRILREVEEKQNLYKNELMRN